MIVAVSDPSNMAIIDGIGFKTGYSVELVLASERDITAAIKLCSDFILSVGGHPGAAGLSLRAENLTVFRRCLLESGGNDARSRCD